MWELKGGDQEWAQRVFPPLPQPSAERRPRSLSPAPPLHTGAAGFSRLEQPGPPNRALFEWLHERVVCAALALLDSSPPASTPSRSLPVALPAPSCVKEKGTGRMASAPACPRHTLTLAILFLGSQRGSPLRLSSCGFPPSFQLPQTWGCTPRNPRMFTANAQCRQWGEQVLPAGQGAGCLIFLDCQKAPCLGLLTQ